MHADAQRTGPPAEDREEPTFGADSIAEDWNVQLLGRLPREDGDETAEPLPPSTERTATPPSNRR